MSATGEYIEIDLGHSLFFSRKDGIIQVEGKDHTYTLDELQLGIEHMKTICKDHPYAFLFIAQKGSMFDSAALRYFSTRGLLSFSGPRAYVLKSRTQRMLAAIFVSSKNNETPAKVFSTVDEAVEWLKSLG